MDSLTQKCIEYGINHFDTACVYGQGKAETQLGITLKNIKARREDLVISTKLYAYKHGLCRKFIIEGMRSSLARLQLDYVDLIYAHRPDYDTPLEEQCRAFSWLIDQGYAHYWGTSEWGADRITAAISICRDKGLHEPVIDQCQYSMLYRKSLEKQHRLVKEQFGYGFATWGTLA